MTISSLTGSSLTGSSLTGCILGTAMGDAIGLPYEGLSRRRAAKLLGPPDRHRLVLGRGMVSDDTEHTCFTAQALLASGGDVDRFRQDLAWRLRWWLLGLPAGIGLATLKSIVRLWLGFNPRQSGIFSAGNGPAMRAAILGAAICDRAQLRSFVRASTRLTHTDPKAEYGAFAVALAAQLAQSQLAQSQLAQPPQTAVPAERYITELEACLGPEAQELIDLLGQAITSAQAGETTLTFAQSLGQTQGVSGYIYRSVPVAIQAWFRYPDDYEAAIIAIVECGGDTDSVAAIAGGIIGTSVGKAGIPGPWLEGLVEWPCSIAWMERLAEQLEAGSQSGDCIGPIHPVRPIRLPLWAIPFRNLCFLLIVLFHGFRRFLPPY